MAELQTIVLAFECVLFSCSVDLFTNSQAALDACRLDLKSYSDILGNECANTFAKVAAIFNWHLPYLVSKHYFKASDIAVSGNSKHFV
ncbi:hypothetical protein G9A89_008580 [Geosiphon pyriformis]|nr:hypothetical protein G9A89_008580 [Geosiphon pyriformis]